MLETASENVNLTTAGHDTKRFEFGKNWQKFLTRLNDQRINEAGKSLQLMLHRDSLEGLSFLDIGCGSGLFSLAALRLGAEKVFSFDYDPQSVACTLSLKEKCFPDNQTWVVSQGSVLDDHFMKSLGQWDIVYSWGVLHHTGDLWKGMANSILPVKDNGCLFIAIYNDQGLASRIWHWVKKTYNILPSGLRFIILIPAFIRLWGPTIVKDLFRGCPMKNWRNYYYVRGMSPWEDVVDWVGGYPFEVAKPDEIFHFFHRQGFELEELFTSNNLGCNQFVFVRRK